MGREFCINFNGQSRQSAYGAHYQRVLYWNALLRLKLKKPKYLPLAPTMGELDYPRRLEKLYHNISVGYPPVFGLFYCSLPQSYNRILFSDASRCE